MLRWNLAMVLSVALVGSMTATTSPVLADSLKEGDSIGVFYVTKVAGAENDDVEPGEDLCYRCRYGSRPMVIVFARRTDGKVPELVQAMDAAILEHEESSLKGLLTLFGDDASKLKEEAGKVARTTAVQHVPVVVARETKTGPLNYKLSSHAAVTVVIAKDSQVVSTHIFSADAIDVPAVMDEVKRMLP